MSAKLCGGTRRNKQSNFLQNLYFIFYKFTLSGNVRNVYILKFIQNSYYISVQTGTFFFCRIASILVAFWEVSVGDRISTFPPKDQQIFVKSQLEISCSKDFEYVMAEDHKDRGPTPRRPLRVAKQKNISKAQHQCLSLSLSRIIIWYEDVYSRTHVHTYDTYLPVLSVSCQQISMYDTSIYPCIRARYLVPGSTACMHEYCTTTIRIVCAV